MAYAKLIYGDADAISAGARTRRMRGVSAGKFTHLLVQHGRAIILENLAYRESVGSQSPKQAAWQKRPLRKFGRGSSEGFNVILTRG